MTLNAWRFVAVGIGALVAFAIGVFVWRLSYWDFGVKTWFAALAIPVLLLIIVGAQIVRVHHGR